MQPDMSPEIDFNPRSREGSDGRKRGSENDYAISIHAPVKGATKQDGNDLIFRHISIHAPVKGATLADP